MTYFYIWCSFRIETHFPRQKQEQICQTCWRGNKVFLVVLAGTEEPLVQFPTKISCRRKWTFLLYIYIYIYRYIYIYIYIYLYIYIYIYNKNVHFLLQLIFVGNWTSGSSVPASTTKKTLFPRQQVWQICSCFWRGKWVSIRKLHQI